MRGATVVVPCYNEAARFSPDAMARLLALAPGVRLLFVDDGSTDDTRAVLETTVAAHAASMSVLPLPRNQGKAEAVRQGLLLALKEGAEVVGYFDADLSTPVEELARLLALLSERKVQVIMGARVGLLGYAIDRKASRHYLGRIFATLASLVLELRVYDTQCGAKLFARTPALEAALAVPFLSRWAFDVELLGRLLVGAPGIEPLSAQGILEVPLQAWQDVPGSKLKAPAMVKAASDLAVIATDLKKRRRELRAQRRT